MNFKGKFHSVSRDVDGHLIVAFRSYEEKKTLSELEDVKEEGTLSISAEKPKTKRSLSANAYYRVLCGKMAAYMHISTSRMHNVLLRRYGAIQTVDGDDMICFIPDTEEAEEMALEADTFHIKPTSSTILYKDGNMRRMYMVLKPSHEYDTKEMSVLIHGIVDECNNCGIPTATPAEIAEMMAHYGKHHSKQ